MESYFAQSKLLWSPIQPRTAFVEVLRREINRKHGLNLKTYHDLHKYSIEDYTFWLDLWHFLGIISSVPPSKDAILEPGKYPEIPNWFPTARLNYAENLLYRKDDAIALTGAGESGALIHISFRELNERVRAMSTALRVNGLQVGDRVAAIVTNSVNAVVVAIATAAVGGIFSSTATDMGTQGILDRYRQIQPKFIFAETETLYAGKIINLLPKVAEVVGDLSTQGLQQAILLPSRISGKELRIPNMSKSTTLASFLKADDKSPMKFEQLPFGQPLYILYSSGTSGKPKCIIHSAGGVLLNTKKCVKVGYNLSSEDTYFQYTTTGWMMWTFMLTGLACGSRIILYDGSPFHPSVETYLKFISDQGVTTLGTSPRFLSEVQGRGIKPLELGSFESLRTMGVTGAIFTPPMFEWTQEAFGKHVHLVSTSGGTDICSSFVTGTPSEPVYSGEIQVKDLGMKVEVFDPSGQNIEHTGLPGELVCTRPHPSLPLGFWGDESGQKLRDAYFNMYPGVWRQGDFIVVNPETKGLMILGRSDGVLNPSGVRFGSGEIYTIMEQFSTHVDDSLCIGQRRQHDKDERVLLFLKMRPGCKFTPEFEASIKQAIRKGLSARHVPAYIFEVTDIPYTVNGKKIEIAVKQIVSGSNLQPSGTVANPESLQLYYKYRDIESVVGAVKAKL
ncbi:Acetoacetyl-CoA synthetase [Psilocybe cubensis]|uniref:AMP-dependent synthetase/ligase domain-containing protein n=2 Tax=Psilocybe cubensis TaxID=181762 RepID=A0A8H8CQC2_PSICU|nr:Acetoacetyl-CoA synthetase [Psilocybe cubensis]KAH9485547.1 Acetoacetyl-CoA synthetase [Psilocybe cubensis]